MRKSAEHTATPAEGNWESRRSVPLCLLNTTLTFVQLPDALYSTRLPADFDKNTLCTDDFLEYVVKNVKGIYR